jgi:hypothetical protein
MCLLRAKTHSARVKPPYLSAFVEVVKVTIKPPYLSAFVEVVKVTIKPPYLSAFVEVVKVTIKKNHPKVILPNGSKMKIKLRMSIIYQKN